jgi:caa(3)-type oxidase subunit IV
VSHDISARPAPHPLEPAKSHVMPVRTLVGVWVFLCAMALLNAVLGGVNMGSAAVLVALVIASTMAVVSALYFMHLRYESLFIVMVLLLTLIFITLFISFSLTDTQAYKAQLIPGEAPGMVKALWQAGPAPAPLARHR